MSSRRSRRTSSPVNAGRRKFLLAAPALGAAACAPAAPTQNAPAAPPAPASPPTVVRYDLTRESGALDPDEVVRSACQFCNSLCGIDVLKKSGRIIGIRGDAADPVAQGGLCVKAEMMPQLVYNPRRIKTPLKRTNPDKSLSHGVHAIHLEVQVDTRWTVSQLKVEVRIAVAAGQESTELGMLCPGCSER